MAKINYPFISEIPFHETGEPDIKARVCDATESLLKTISILDDLAKPKNFKMGSTNLIRFDQLPSNGNRHSVSVMGDIPIDEIVQWQVYGNIGDKIVNVVVYHIFHTHKENRSGGGEYFINGKKDCKPEFGGITLDDVWQDNNKWQYELDFLPKEALIA